MCFTDQNTRSFAPWTLDGIEPALRRVVQKPQPRRPVQEVVGASLVDTLADNVSVRLGGGRHAEPMELDFGVLFPVSRGDAGIERKAHAETRLFFIGEIVGRSAVASTEHAPYTGATGGDSRMAYPPWRA